MRACMKIQKTHFFTVGSRSGRVPAQRHSDREIGRLSVQVDIARTQNATAVVHMMYRLCVCVQLYRTGRVYATATAPTVSLCLVPPAAPVLPVSGYAYVAPVPNRVYHCRYVAGSWVFRVRSLDTVQLDTDTGEQYNIGSQIPLQ